MATLEQEKASREELKTLLNELSTFSASSLARADLGPDLSFESGVIFFSRTLRLFHALGEADLDDIPTGKLSQVAAQARETIARCRQIQEFSLQKHPSNPMQVRDQFINQIRDSYDNVFEVVAPTVAFTVRKGTDFVRLEEQARATLGRAEKAANEHEKSMSDARTSAEQLVEEVRKIAREAGVSQHAVHFKEEADKHDIESGKWLKATVTLSIITIVVGGALLAFYFSQLSTLTPGQSLQLAISKVVVMSALLSAAFWAGRTYRAHRHNAVVNRHRQNALATFQTFAKAASDDQTRNAVLLQATQCIFGSQPSGYISADNEGAPTSQVLEIIRSATPKQ